LTYLERQKCYGLDKKILFKKTIIWPWGQRSRSHEGHYSMWHTALWSCIYELSVHEQFCWIYLNYLTLRSKVKVPQRSLWYVTHRLMVMHPHTNYHWPTSKDKNVMAQTRKYYMTITFLSFEIGQWYFVCGCMTIRRYVANRNDLHGTLTFDLKVK
jgi:hypothetical protein